MRHLLLLLTLATPMVLFAQTPPIEPGVSQELARWRFEHYGDVRYKLNLTLEKMSSVLKGTIEIRVKLGPRASSPASPHSSEVTPIILDWRRLRGFEDGSVLSNVLINGNVAHRSNAMPNAHLGGGLPYDHQNDHLIFRDGVVAGENVIKFDFTSPILPSGSAITRYVDKEDGSEYIYSLFVPSDASTAFPVFDQPDLKARFQLTLRTPIGWNLVSNTDSEPIGHPPIVEPGTRLPSALTTVAPGMAVSNFRETNPISTYVFAFAAGPFSKIYEANEDAIIRNFAKQYPGRNSISLEEIRRQSSYVFVRKSQAAKFKPHAGEVFRLNREAVKYFEQYFDYKFPFPKYDLVLIPEFPFGGMEHAGATFLRESSVIFPQEPTKNDLVNRATLIFHETAHQWFGDTVTMRWFDDLWLKEGFATFTAYKALEKIMPEMNAWKIFYERIKQGAYQTDSTRGTTAIYQPIANLSAAKSAYGNIVYNKAPAFLRQAEFYLGEDKFQTAVRAFLRKHEFGNATWQDLVKEFEAASDQDLKVWADGWIKRPGLPTIRSSFHPIKNATRPGDITGFVQTYQNMTFVREKEIGKQWGMKWKTRLFFLNHSTSEYITVSSPGAALEFQSHMIYGEKAARLIFPNYQDYGYGIFLLDEKSRDYVLKNIQNEKDPFLRTMMWGALWDSVREGELDPRVFVELVVKNLAEARTTVRASSSAEAPELDESTLQMLLSRVSIAMNYYISEPDIALTSVRASASGAELRSRVEELLIERMRTAPTLGQRITFYRALLNIASSEKARNALKTMLKSVPGAVATGALEAKSPVVTAPGTGVSIPLKTKDKFDIVTRLLILGDPDAPKLLAYLERTETSDDARRYAYAARAGIGTAENKAKYWNDFINNSEISESWIEAAFGPWNSIRHSELTRPYLQKALQELPNHKRNRKIFFVNGWLAAFIGGQRSEEALAIVNKFLADDPKLDNDLRLKILENADLIERAVKIRGKYGN